MTKKYRRIDLSHTIEDGMITYKGLPAPIICDYYTREESKMHYDEGTSFQIGKIEMVSNTGTYLDTPFHRFEDGKDLSEIELEKLAHLEGIKIKIPTNLKAIDKYYFEGLELKGKAVLVYTNWSIYWGTDVYFENNPYLTKDAAEYLVSQEVVLVGIDSLNIDNTNDKSRPVHTILLGNEIPIVEHMCNLENLPNNQIFYFNAVPPKIKDFGTFPVRAYALIES